MAMGLGYMWCGLWGVLFWGRYGIGGCLLGLAIYRTPKTSTSAAEKGRTAQVEWTKGAASPGWNEPGCLFSGPSAAGDVDVTVTVTVTTCKNVTPPPWFCFLFSFYFHFFSLFEKLCVLL